MADKRISQLIERVDIANNDVLPIVASGATTTNKVTISTIQNWMQDNLDVGVTSVGITLGSSGTDVNVTGSPITTSGNITINIPTASATNRGLVSTGSQTFAGTKTFNSDIIVNGVNVGRGGTNVPSNTRVGNSALQDNTTGANNTAVGFSSLIFTTTGSSNTAVGHQVLSNANGSVNTAVGVSSLFNLSTGDNNLGLGNQAGTQISGGANHTTSNNSIFIGSDTKPAANNQINQIVIGHQAVGQGSNTVTIGNSSITSNKFFGRVIHADAVNADESATLGQVNTLLGGYVTLGTAQTITGSKTISNATTTFMNMNSTNANGASLNFQRNGVNMGHIGNSGVLGVGVLDDLEVRAGSTRALHLKTDGGQITLATTGAVTFSSGFVSFGNNGYIRNDSAGWLQLQGGSNGTRIMNASNSSAYLSIAESTGAVTLTGAYGISSGIYLSGSTYGMYGANRGITNASAGIQYFSVGSQRWFSGVYENSENFGIYSVGTGGFPLTLNYSTGAATFSSSVTAEGTFIGKSNAIYQNGSTNILNVGSDQWMYGGTNSDGGVFVYGNNKLHLSTNSQRRLSIDGSGNVGIGTTSPNTLFHAAGSATINDVVYLQRASSSLFLPVMNYWNGSGQPLNGTKGDIVAIGNAGGDGVVFANANAEVLRITSGNALQLSGNSTTFSIGSISGRNRIQWDSTEFAFFNTANGYTAIGASAFNTRSDYRLKENVAPVQDALSKITSLKPCTFNFIAEPEKEVVGFIAHEVQEVFPQAISGEKDGFRIEQVEVSPAELDEEGNVITEAVIEEKEVPVYQGIDHSKLVPLLVAAIQEQQEQIKSLTEQVEALKSQING